ncbi:MAG: TraR/DksA C4-type zinc finger protein [Aquisalinus sp.]|nr:TraR/DksA C4-type zinc finger protein [Aquisalinus sp.]
MSLDTERFRQLLITRRQELLDLSQLATEARKPVELDQQSVGRLSRQDALQQQAMANAQEKMRRRDLNRIDAALARIEDSTYSLCLECEKKIGEKRLLVDPATELCLDCKT